MKYTLGIPISSRYNSTWVWLLECGIDDRQSGRDCRNTDKEEDRCMLCTRHSLNSARMLSVRRSRYKFFWQRSSRVHGVGVVSEEFVNNVVEVKRISARLMIAILVTGKKLS